MLKAQARPLSRVLLERQLLLLGKIARCPDGDVLRGSVFVDGSCDIKSMGPRKRGRPRATWTNRVHSEALRLAGSKEALAAMLQDSRTAQSAWERAVREHCK